MKEEVKNTKAKTEEELMALAGVITKTRFSCFNFQHTVNIGFCDYG